MGGSPMTREALRPSQSPWAQGLDSKEPSYLSTALYSLQRAFSCLVPIHPLRWLRKQRGRRTPRKRSSTRNQPPSFCTSAHRQVPKYPLCAQRWMVGTWGRCGPGPDPGPSHCYSAPHSAGGSCQNPSPIPPLACPHPAIVPAA